MVIITQIEIHDPNGRNVQDFQGNLDGLEDYLGKERRVIYEIVKESLAKTHPKLLVTYKE